MLQGILVALIGGLAYMESRIGGQHMLDRPIIIGPLVGLVMGDFNTGLVLGGQLELVWMGLVGIGTTTPPDVVVGSALATALAIKTGANWQTTLTLAVPIALIAQIIQIAIGSFNTVFTHYADRQIEKKNWKGIAIGEWGGVAMFFLAKFVPILVGFLVGTPVIKLIVKSIPKVIQDGLAQSGNLLPALGIAMLMQLTYDKKYAPFLFLGFALVAFLKVPMIGIAMFGFIIAYVYYQFKPQANNDEGELL
ncbi:PTS sugar transporter subunit IIC [Lactobacillus sp. ESL0684]|uniref:PTS mannose/fructose/sorbose/N-acetylgalactosamine transporter subunit IIC n=1 Tax=unclassified Lactobacillus TaxID=2620435 RepID=UPI0023F9CFD6|nr:MULTISPECIES: PTS sugar transporter subunit IIC [unclassified Lactobacillus]WEV40152.1 PTS sugar transporter subunit IIC [Lactobacillus sp. ESL0681]WEV43326.1 PTS sugar transporter subunit IIC [Lactobacillus sp. ESL0684]